MVGAVNFGRIDLAGRLTGSKAPSATKTAAKGLDKETEKKLEKLKQEVTDRLDSMAVNAKVKQLSVHMDDEFLTRCLENPEKLEEAFKILEEFFAQDADTAGENRGYGFIGINSMSTIDPNHLAQRVNKKRGLEWEKDFDKEQTSKALQEAVQKKLEKMPQQLEAQWKERELMAFFNLTAKK